MEEGSKRNQMTETIIISSKTPLKNNLKETLKEIEVAYIKEALNDCKGVVSHAALKLGLRRTTLIEKMKKHKISGGN